MYIGIIKVSLKSGLTERACVICKSITIIYSFTHRSEYTSIIDIFSYFLADKNTESRVNVRMLFYFSQILLF